MRVVIVGFARVISIVFALSFFVRLVVSVLRLRVILLLGFVVHVLCVLTCYLFVLLFCLFVCVWCFVWFITLCLCVHALRCMIYVFV